MRRIAFLCCVLLCVPISAQPSTSSTAVSRDEFNRLLRLVESQQSAIAELSRQVASLRTTIAGSQTTQPAAENVDPGPYGIKAGMTPEEVKKLVPYQPSGGSDTDSGGTLFWVWRGNGGSNTGRLTVWFKSGRVSHWKNEKY